MISIKSSKENLLIIKNSKFIGKIFYVNNISEVINILNEAGDKLYNLLAN